MFKAFLFSKNSLVFSDINATSQNQIFGNPSISALQNFRIIEQYNDKINLMADLLLEKETIYAEDIEPILGPAAQPKKEETDTTKNE